MIPAPQGIAAAKDIRLCVAPEGHGDKNRAEATATSPLPGVCNDPGM